MIAYAQKSRGARTRTASLLGVFFAAPLAQAQFTSGSNGSYGPISITTGVVTLDLPQDGIFHATTINVASGATLRFAKNVANTPVYLLATGDVTIFGHIDVSGQNPTTAFPFRGGVGGPGGFDGGWAQMAGQSAPGDGQGPGGGRGGVTLNPSTSSNDPAVVGHGAYGVAGTVSRPANGAIYGSNLLIPLVGGSGGGGTTTSNLAGAGGGGAILIASNTRIDLRLGANVQNDGTIRSLGGGNDGTLRPLGSGGAVRLVAPWVEGNGRIRVEGGGGLTGGAAGRIRIDAIFKENLAISMTPTTAGTVGGNMVVFPPNLPKLEIVEAAGRVIDPGSNEPVTVQLPLGAPAQQVVKVRATHFAGTARVHVVLTPEFGSKVSYDLDIANPGPDPAVASATVEFPANQLTRVDVWTR